MKAIVYSRFFVLITFGTISVSSYAATQSSTVVTFGNITYKVTIEYTRGEDAVNVQWSKAVVSSCSKESSSASVQSHVEWSTDLMSTTNVRCPVSGIATVVGIGLSADSYDTAQGMFRECAKLENVILPNTLSYIGALSFLGCCALQTIEIPNSVTNIGWRAFYQCTSITTIDIPESVTTISDSAFYECESLKDIKMGANVESIKDLAFYRCRSLTTITIPASTTNIAFNAFKSCDGIQRFIVDPANPVYASYDGALYTKDLKTLIGYPGGRTDVKLPSDAVETMEDAFTGCGKLWAEWYRAFQKTRYDLTDKVEDRAISSIAVDRDTALDNFVLTDGKVYDTVLRIVNLSGNAVTLTLPSGHSYETFKGATPLTIPANSRNILTITRTEDDVFLVTREELETVK